MSTSYGLLTNADSITDELARTVVVVADLISIVNSTVVVPSASSVLFRVHDCVELRGNHDPAPEPAEKVPDISVA